MRFSKDRIHYSLLPLTGQGKQDWSKIWTASRNQSQAKVAAASANRSGWESFIKLFTGNAYLKPFNWMLCELSVYFLSIYYPVTWYLVQVYLLFTYEFTGHSNPDYDKTSSGFRLNWIDRNSSLLLDRRGRTRHCWNVLESQVLAYKHLMGANWLSISAGYLPCELFSSC